MPTGGWQVYSLVARNIAPHSKVKNPTRLRALDIGIGGGRWGLLWRDVMEWRAGRYHKSDWVYTLHGVEAWEAYRGPCWDFYDDILIGSIQDRIDTLIEREPYDFIFCMDMIEHVPKAIGVDILDRLIRHTRNRLLISFPDGSNTKHALKQGEVLGNHYEDHISLWTVDELAQRYDILDRHNNGFAALRGQG